MFIGGNETVSPPRRRYIVRASRSIIKEINRLVLQNETFPTFPYNTFTRLFQLLAFCYTGREEYFLSPRCLSRCPLVFFDLFIISELFLPSPPSLST